MAVKKSELYSSLWKSCDELRGGMDASQYKDYVLVLLFVKYVSDRYAGHKVGIVGEKFAVPHRTRGPAAPGTSGEDEAIGYHAQLSHKPPLSESGN